MIKREHGFTAIELLLALGSIALIALGAMSVIFQVFPAADRNNGRIVSASQVQDAGYWLSRDAEMAETIIATSLTPPDLLIVTWTERDYDSVSSVYHSATYTMHALSGNVGQLKRQHWSSGGANDEVLVANFIYYNTGDPAGSQASYTDPVLTLQLTSRLGDATETRQYRVTRRPNF